MEISIESARLEEAKRLSEKIHNFIKDYAINVKERADGTFQSFLKSVQDATVNYDQEWEGLDPNIIVNDPDRFSKFIRMRDAVYHGPVTIIDSLEWADLVTKAQEVKGLSDMTETQDGQIVLLRRIFDNPEYNNAYLNKDLEILQLCPPTRVDEADKLPDYLAGLVEQSKGHVNQAQETTESTRKLIIEKINVRFEDFKNNLIANLNASIANRRAIVSKMSNELNNARISRDTIRYLKIPYYPPGLDADDSIYNLNLTSYLTASPDPKIEEIASSDQFDVAESFAKLAMQTNSILPLNLKGQALRVNSTPIATFDSKRMLEDKNRVANECQSALDAPIRMQDRFGRFKDYATNMEIRIEIAIVRKVLPNGIAWDDFPDDQGARALAIPYYHSFEDRAKNAIRQRRTDVTNRFQATRRIEIL